MNRLLQQHLAITPDVPAGETRLGHVLDGGVVAVRAAELVAADRH